MSTADTDFLWITQRNNGGQEGRVCVGGMAINGSFVGTRDKNHYITLDFISVCLSRNKVAPAFSLNLERFSIKFDEFSFSTSRTSKLDLKN